MSYINYIKICEYDADESDNTDSDSIDYDYDTDENSNGYYLYDRIKYINKLDIAINIDYIRMKDYRAIFKYLTIMIEYIINYDIDISTTSEYYYLINNINPLNICDFLIDNKYITIKAKTIQEANIIELILRMVINNDIDELLELCTMIHESSYNISKMINKEDENNYINLEDIYENLKYDTNIFKYYNKSKSLIMIKDKSMNDKLINYEFGIYIDKPIIIDMNSIHNILNNELLIENMTNTRLRLDYILYNIV
jgi:hypothetical protein